MLEEEEDNEWERIHEYQGRYLPLSEYDDADVRYVYADPRTKRLYTLVFNETSDSYQIVDIRRRRILAKSSVSAAIFTQTYNSKRELKASPEKNMDNTSGNEVGQDSEGWFSSWFMGGATRSDLKTEYGNLNIAGKESVSGYVSAMAKSAAITKQALGENHQHRKLKQRESAPVILTHPEMLKWSGTVDVEVLKMQKAISNCPSAFCDNVGLECHAERHRSILSNQGYTTLSSKRNLVKGMDVVALKCCARVNSETLCNEPPCWFHVSDPVAMYDCGHIDHNSRTPLLQEQERLQSLAVKFQQHKRSGLARNLIADQIVGDGHRAGTTMLGPNGESQDFRLQSN
jgi:hypothetical protein